MKTIDQVDVTEKAVIVRGSLDVPIENGKVVDNSRLKTLVKTISYLREKDAKVILIGHLGRPEGKDLNFSLRPVANALSELMQSHVQLSSEVSGENLKWEIKALTDGDVLMIENLRFDPREKENNAEFALELASYADVYVNECFSNSHRNHASMSGIPIHIPSAAGFSLAREVDRLKKLLNPTRPYIVIIGGAKKDKIDHVEGLLKYADKIIVGGILANTFLKALGVDIKNSKHDEESVERAKKILQENSNKIILPNEVVVAKEFDKNSTPKVISASQIPEEHMILDIGPNTFELYKKIINVSKSVFWGGPIGVFEWPKFAKGTKELLKVIAESEIFSVMGGGESAEAAYKFGFADKMSFVSTGGGASLQFIEGKPLPALEALEQSERIFFH